MDYDILLLMSTIASLTTELRSAALKLGFDAVGIAPAMYLARAEDAIRARVECGRLRDYGFARKSASVMTHPELIMSGARSIVDVALSYKTKDVEPDDDEIRGRVARFARGQDYHVVVQERLQRLGEWLSDRVPDVKFTACVDTGPVIDRAVAQLAGIGSYGKNNTIIVPRFGSWVVLGELITDVELEPDEPAPLEQCGNCSKCIEACPAGAIVEPFVIDQTRCVSHLTQMKGTISEEARRLIGNRIYGCDTCQEVCPKNKCTKIGNFPMEGGIGANPELLPLLNISEDEFDRFIRPTAAGWIGRMRFRRNVAVALGNIGDASVLPALRKALEDADPVLREHIEWAIARCGG